MWRSSRNRRYSGEQSRQDSCPGGADILVVKGRSTNKYTTTIYDASDANKCKVKLGKGQGKFCGWRRKSDLGLLVPLGMGRGA